MTNRDEAPAKTAAEVQVFGELIAQAMPATVSTIIRDYLAAGGFDGLAGPWCGCDIDDLMPCHTSGDRCQPAYRWHGPEGCALHDTEDCEDPGVAECECYRTERQET